jgi:hypothetical protein
MKNICLAFVLALAAIPARSQADEIAGFTPILAISAGTPDESTFDYNQAEKDHPGVQVDNAYLILVITSEDGVPLDQVTVTPLAAVVDGKYTTQCLSQKVTILHTTSSGSATDPSWVEAILTYESGNEPGDRYCAVEINLGSRKVKLAYGFKN